MIAGRSVAFHTGVEDPVVYAGRLLKKALALNSRLVVTGLPDTLSALDERLWTQEPNGFVPHARWGVDTPSAVLLRSPLWLVDESSWAQASDWSPAGRTIRVGLDALDFLDGTDFDRIIEVVGADEAQRRRGQLRWKRYRDQGCTLSHHPYAA